MTDLTVIVQTCPPRREDAQATFESLRESDVGDFEVMEHPAGMERCRFFRSVLVRMAEAPTPYVIRCEDDILVNRHLRHNFLTWPALEHSSFGCGWLYVSEMAIHHESAKRIGGGHLIRNMEIMYGSLCVGLSTELAAACLDLLDAKISKYGCPLSGCARGRRCLHATRPKENKHHHGQDTLFAQAVWRLGKRVFYHEPVLAENRLITSARGTGFPANIDKRHLQAGRYFSPGWKR